MQDEPDEVNQEQSRQDEVRLAEWMRKLIRRWAHQGWGG